MANPSKPRTRRTKTSHVGVKLRRRTRTDTGKEVWLARWRDPDTGKQRECSLGALGLTTAEARREWAINKANKLNARAAEIKAGAPLLTRTDVPSAVELYLERCQLELRASTLSTYRSNTAKFVRWAEHVGVRTIESLRPTDLARFRVWLAQQPAGRPQRGGRRGGKKPGGRPSPATLNSDLAACRAFLNDTRRLGLLPKCSSDGISDALRKFAAERPRPPFLRPNEIQSLLQAALRHDACSFSMTREEKNAGCSTGQGDTPRYRPVAPLVLFSLLAGTRLNEAVSLTWDHVHLDALEGAGEVIITASISKTRTERSIALDITPCLRTLLATLRLRAGDDERAFGQSIDDARNAMKRLVREFGAPTGVNWKSTRSTCGTYLSNSPGIYGAASTFYSARRLGHSVTVAERHYLGVVRVSADARTLEHAMEIIDLANMIVPAAGGDRERVEAVG